MTDTPKPSQEASEAWQDVDQWVQRLYAAIVTESDESLHESLRAVVVELRAADAQQSAALHDQLDIVKLQVEVLDLLREADAQQIAALRAENDQIQQQLEETYVAALNRERTKCEAAAAQLPALRAERDQNGR